MAQRKNRIGTPFHKSVSYMFLTYWTVLVIWQNVSRIQARSSLDMLIKIGLLIYFSMFFLRRARRIDVKIILPFLMAIPLVVTGLQETDFSIGMLISYCYPIIFILMVYGMGDKFEINKKQLLAFYNGIIIVTMYSAVYAIIFCTDHFVNVFSITNAYSNELSSFFISPHEYGMYMAAGAISCVLCLKLDRIASRAKRVLYYLSLVILLVNMVLSFSRTATFSLALFALIYTFYENKNVRGKLLLLMLAAVCVVLMSPTLRNFVFNIVMKGNHLGVREKIYVETINVVREANLYNKLFGFGINRTNSIIRLEFGVGSAHNAYLQILLNFGAIGLIFLLGFIVSQIYTSLKLLKINQYFGGISMGLCIMAAAMMFTNTAIVFTSSIDSFFLTIFMFVVPKYVRNAIIHNRFD